MQCYAGFDSTDHLGADCGVMDVCANFYAGEDGDDVEGEGIAHCIYNLSINPCNKKWRRLRRQLPMNKSGTNFETASHARYIDPKLCPSIVNFGHVASSTRYLELRNTKCSDVGKSSISNLDWQRTGIRARSG